MLVARPASPVLVNYECDKCKECDSKTVYYKRVGDPFPTTPAQYPHVCPECGDRKIFLIEFPSLRYVPAGTKLDLNDFIKKVVT